MVTLFVFHEIKIEKHPTEQFVSWSLPHYSSFCLSLSLCLSLRFIFFIWSLSHSLRVTVSSLSFYPMSGQVIASL